MKHPRRLQSSLALLLLLLPILSARASTTPELEVARLSKYLKPIADERWQEVAGERLAEKYEITRGDTLYDISKRLFGDPKYWPKIWALNNSSITNPHLIRPGRLIAFMPGTGTSLPAVAIGSDGATAESDAYNPGYNSRGLNANLPEWKKLPPQRWDLYNASIGKRVEEIGFGFDTKDRIKKLQKLTFQLRAFAATQPAEILGTLYGSQRNAISPGLGDEVYLKSPDDRLGIGETFAVTGMPQSFGPIESPDGYSYLILGTVKITARKDDLYVGKITGQYHWMERGNWLVRLPQRIPILSPVAGPKPLDARILVDRNFSTATIAQHKQIFLDRGSEDGLAPGMVFRVHRADDPATREALGQGQIVKEAEAMVIQVSERYSTALVTWSMNPINEGMTATLVTDEGALAGTPNLKQVTPEEDELDKLDGDDTLLKSEEKELLQLERWKSNASPSPSPSPAPVSAPTPTPLPEPTPEPTSTEIPGGAPAPAGEDMILEPPTAPQEPEALLTPLPEAELNSSPEIDQLLSNP